MRNIKIAGVIDVAESYGRSVNINTSFTHEDLNAPLLESYIPTEPAVRAFGEIVEALYPKSPRRARLITGQYGTGKSHFGLVIANFFNIEYGSDFLEVLVERLRRKDQKDTEVILRNRSAMPKRFLVVVRRPSTQPFDASLLSALRSTLDKEESKFEPTTYYAEAARIVGRWEVNDDMQGPLKQELARRKLTPNLLRAGLTEYKVESYKQFKEVFERITTLPFVPEHYASAGDAYLETAKHLRSVGDWEGILVIADEFGEYLRTMAAHPESDEALAVQNFAEECNASRENQVHFIAIVHRTLADYARGHQRQEDWEKVSGRFVEHNLDFAGQHQEMVDIINSVVDVRTKTDTQKNNWSEIKKHFGALRDWIKNQRLFEGQSDRWIHEELLEGSYPLHPATVFCLPWLAQRLGQVNRTAFKFLAEQEKGGLLLFADSNQVLNDDGNLNLYTPDKLIEYFGTSAAEKESYRGIMRAREEALAICGTEPTATRIVDLLTVMEITNRPELQRNRKVITSLIASSLSNGKTASDVLDTLVGQGVISYREAIDTFELPRRGHGDMGARQAVDTIKERLRDDFNLLEELGRYIKLSSLVGRGYEKKYIIARKATRELVSVDHLNNLEPYVREIASRYDPGKGTYKGDATILYVVATSSEELRTAKRRLTGGTGSEQLVIAIAKQPFTKAEEALDLAAISYIRDELGLVIDESAVDEEDLRRMEKEKKAVVQKAADEYLKASNQSWHFAENVRASVDKGGENDLLSDVMELNFYQTPPIHDESLSGVGRDTQKSQRLQAMRAVLEIEGPIRIEKSRARGGADQRMLRAALRDTEVLRKIGDVGSAEEFEVNREVPANSTLATVWGYLNEHVIQVDTLSVPMGPIVRTLLARPYGLSRPLIELLMSAYLRGIKNQCAIFKGVAGDAGKTRQAEQIELTAEQVRSLVANPDKFVIVYYEMTPEQQRYLKELIGTLREADQPISGGLFECARDALMEWFANLATGARQARDLDPQGQTLSILLSDMEVLEDARSLLLESLPTALEVDLRTWTSKESDQIIKAFTIVKEELDNYVQRRAIMAVDQLCELFQARGKTYENLGNVASQWYSALSEAHRLHHFDGEAGAIIRCVRDDESPVVERFLVQLPRGLGRNPYTSWTDDSEVDAFIYQVKFAKNSVETWSPPRGGRKKAVKEDAAAAQAKSLKSHIMDLLNGSDLSLTQQVQLLKDLLEEKQK